MKSYDSKALEQHYRKIESSYSDVNSRQVIEHADVMLLKYKLPEWIGIDQGARGLDLGCGTARWLLQFLRYSKNFYGLDISPKQLKVAMDAIEQFFGSEVAAKLIKANATVLPFRDGSFDIVCAIHVLEHLPEPSSCLREVRRVLRSGGKLYAEIPNMYDFHSPMKLGARILKLLPEKIANDIALKLTGKRFVKSKYFDEHLHKWPFSLSWMHLIRSYGFKILKIRMNTIFPPIYEIPKIGLDINTFYRIRFIKMVDDRTCSLFPFKYLGQSTMILAQKHGVIKG